MYTALRASGAEFLHFKGSYIDQQLPKQCSQIPVTFRVIDLCIQIHKPYFHGDILLYCFIIPPCLERLHEQAFRDQARVNVCVAGITLDEYIQRI